MAFSVGNGRKVVAAAGTAETIESTAHEVREVIITAETNNTGVVAVGGSAVVASLTTRQGIPLFAGDSLSLFGVDLDKVYLDVTVSGDGITYLFTG